MKLLSILIIFTGWLSTAYATETYNIALSNSPANLNPFSSYDSNSQNINRLVHLSLIDLSRKMEPVCIACASYSKRMSSKGFELSFLLKKGLTFWDGEEITAESVERAVKLYQDDRVIKSLFRKAFQKIKKIEIGGRYKITFIYDQFDLDNITDLTLLKIIKIAPRGNHKNLKDIIGAGKYKIVNAQEMRIELLARDLSRRFIFKVVKDETTLALKMLRGEIDISLANLSPRKIEWLKKNSNILFKDVASTNLQYLAINNRNELLSKKEIREVIYNIIPLEKIIRLKLKGTVLNATGFFPPGFPNYYVKSKNKRSVDKAIMLMKSAGAIKKGTDWYYNGKKISFNWLVVNNKSSIELTRIIKNYFEKFGIKLNVHSQEWGSFYKNFKKGKFDLLMSRWIGFTGPSILRFSLHSKSFAPKGGNRVYYSNKNFDHLLDKGLAQVEKVKRIKLIKSALEILNKDHPYIYLWYPKVIWAMQKNIVVDPLFPNTNFVPLINVKRVE